MFLRLPCVIIRRGPSKLSQLIKSNTNDDDFEFGQWIRGVVKAASITSDGKYMPAQIIRDKSGDFSGGSNEISIVCRPPYFTALEVWIGWHDFFGLDILSDDTLICEGFYRHQIHAKNACPLRREEYHWNKTEADMPNWRGRILNAVGQTAEGFDQQGRKIKLEEGKIFVVEDGGPRLASRHESVPFSGDRGP